MAKYNDEHAHARVWNHMVKKGIAHDKKAMLKEWQRAKVDERHALHFSKASNEGFTGGKKTSAHRKSYEEEHENAIHTVHALATHKDFHKAVAEKHHAFVTGGGKTKHVSETWKKHGATQGGTSKTDIAIYHPDKREYDGIRLSMKKGGGSQLMSAGPEETSAVHDHAAREMLKHHPKYKRKTAEEKEAIHKKIMGHMKRMSTHLNGMRTAKSDKELDHLKHSAQHEIDKAHDAHPELNHYVRKEATTGEGKFGKGRPETASYLVKSAQHGKEAHVVHVDDHDYSGPRPRAAKPKERGRSGNVKSDER